jgi:RNA polymerase sigma-70 factor (ECF subfamily)
MRSATTALGLAEEPMDFETFFRDEGLSLGRALYLLTGDRSEAEELLQEAMARAYERWDRVQRLESPAGYVYKTALNLFRRRARRAALRPRAPTREAPDPADVAGARRDLSQALASLSREQREALVLVEWLEFTAEEAAGVLGIKPSSVRTRVHRAKNAIRARLGDRDV